MASGLNERQKHAETASMQQITKQNKKYRKGNSENNYERQRDSERPRCTTEHTNWRNER